VEKGRKKETDLDCVSIALSPFTLLVDSMQIFHLNLHKNHKFSGIAIDLIGPIELGTASKGSCQSLLSYC